LGFAGQRGLFYTLVSTHLPYMNDVCPLLSGIIEVPPIPAIPFSWIAAYILSPIALLTSIASLSLAVPLASVGRFLFALFTQPGLLLLRKKRKGFGQVFESLSKRPIDLALVRVIDETRGRVIMTRVTDSAGRFLAMVPPGRYRMSVNKAGFDFPSRLLAGERFDPNVGPLYTGGIIEHKSNGPLEVNLPIDGPEDRVTVAQAIRRQARRTVHTVFAYGGLVFGVIGVVVSWNWQAWVLLAMHLALFLLFERLTYRPYGRPWGTVNDRITNEPLPHSVVRILDTRFNRVLETAVADRRGQYSFIVGKNNYRLFADRSSYQPYRGGSFEVQRRFGTVTQPIDLTPGGAPIPQQNPSRL